MRQLYFQSEHERLLGILEGLDSSITGVELLLSLANVDYTDELLAGEVGTDSSTPAITMDATIAARPPAELLNAPASLSADIDGIRVTLLDAVMSHTVSKDNSYTTDILAASPGALLDKVVMIPSNTAKHVTEYIGVTPEKVIQDAIYRCSGVGGYLGGSVRIAAFGRPLIYRIAKDKNDSSSTTDVPPAFEDESHPADVLASIQPEVNCLYRDTWGRRGFSCIPMPAPGLSFDSVWGYEVMGGQVLKWTPPALASPDEQYTEVVVRDRAEDGVYPFPPQREPVYYREVRYPPHANRTFFPPFSDKSGNAVVNARQLAVATARSIGNYLLYTGEQTVSFNPLLEKGDVVTFYEDYKDDTGRFRRTWRAIIDSMKHPWGVAHIETVLSCKMYLIRTQQVSDPINVLLEKLAESAGNIATLFGFDNRGLYANDGISDAILRNSSGTFFSPEDSSGQIRVDEDGLWLEILAGSPVLFSSFPSQFLYPSQSLYPSSGDTGGDLFPDDDVFPGDTLFPS